MEFQALITWHIKFQAEFTSPGFLIEIFLLERNYFGWSVGLSFSKCIYIVGVCVCVWYVYAFLYLPSGCD